MWANSFCRCYILDLVQRFLILLLYLSLASTTLRFVAISLSLAAMTINSFIYLLASLQRPLLRCNIINSLQRVWFASQYPGFLSQQPILLHNIYVSFATTMFCVANLLQQQRIVIIMLHFDCDIVNTSSQFKKRCNRSPYIQHTFFWLQIPHLVPMFKF